MGKTVIVIDLNPLSRSARMGTITIVDELTRVLANMIQWSGDDAELSQSEAYDNDAILAQALAHIAVKFSGQDN
jgi:4-phosphopantoate--beta-alanine ligase